VAVLRHSHTLLPMFQHNTQLNWNGLDNSSLKWTKLVVMPRPLIVQVRCACACGTAPEVEPCRRTSDIMRQGD